MHRFVLTSSLSLSLVAFGAVGFAEDSAPAGATCPVAQKLSKLLADWKVAATEAKAQPAAEQAKFKERFASLAKECPIGSRVEPSLVVARDVLASLKACAEASAKSCPLANAPDEVKKTEAFKTGEALGTARAKLIGDLHQLVTYATACGSDAACCAEAPSKAAAISAAKPAEKCDATCSKELAARVAALKASWAKAGDELAKLPPAKHQEIMTNFATMAKASKAVALIPASVVALSEGFDSLDALHVKMGEWAKANPSFLSSIPEEAKKAYEEQNALVRDTGAILRQAAEKMKGVGECPAEKATATTASSN